jgi:GTP-binding protein
LGTTFLKHIERTRVLAHLVDVSQLPEDAVASVLQAVDAINAELQSYSIVLAKKRQVIVLTKLDAVVERKKLDVVDAALHGRCCDVHMISSATGEGIPELVDGLARLLE